MLLNWKNTNFVRPTPRSLLVIIRQISGMFRHFFENSCCWWCRCRRKLTVKITRNRSFRAFFGNLFFLNEDLIATKLLPFATKWCYQHLLKHWFPNKKALMNLGGVGYLDVPLEVRIKGDRISGLHIPPRNIPFISRWNRWNHPLIRSPLIRSLPSRDIRM